MLKISVITVCFNAEQYIEQTIQSVISQKNYEFEYIIIDGASVDKTKQIIQRYESQLTHWVSEPDQGIADAMNKGVALATGEYLLFLHADDYLVDDEVLFKVISRMQADADIHAFDILFKTKDKDILKSTQPFGMRTYFKTPVMHQGAFCKKTLFEQLGGFNILGFEASGFAEFNSNSLRIGLPLKTALALASKLFGNASSTRQATPFSKRLVVPGTLFCS